MSDPHAEMSTAGVIIADRTETASGKVVIGLKFRFSHSGPPQITGKVTQPCAEMSALQLSVTATNKGYGR